MKKRVLALFLLCIMILSMGCGSKNDATVLLMSDVQEGDHPTAIAVDKFAELVNKRTKGRVRVEVFHGDTLGSESEQIQQLTVGGIDLARISGQVSNYDEQFRAFQSLYMYKSEEDMWKVLNGTKGEALLNSEALAENNLIGLAWFSGGSRNFYNNKREIHTPEDLNGLNIRVNTPSMVRFLEDQGATPLNIAYNDITNSIKSGVIDGAENNWPSYISTGHYEVAKYITLDQHTCIPEVLLISKSAFNSLSAEDQQIIKECAKEISEFQIQAMKDYEGEAIKTAQEAGCIITELTEAESAEFREAGRKVNEVVSADDMDTIEWLSQ